MGQKSPVKILYIAPENNAGTLELWQAAHRSLGNEARFVTLFSTKYEHAEDINLNLPLVPTEKWLANVRHLFYKTHGEAAEYEVQSGYPPTWRPHNLLESFFFRFRDLLWTPKVTRAIEKYDLLDYDIYHLEWGHGFFRSGKIVQKLRAMGKHIICTYHGTDIRNRGVIPAIDQVAEVNFTSELDLLHLHPRMEYVFLPYNTRQFNPSIDLNSPVRLCHATTNRFFKGSNIIIDVCERIAREREDAEFVLIENRPHEEALIMKARSDIYIDQISNTGGWGYGMNSVESLSMGICSCTNLIPEYEEFIPDHPFVNVNADTLDAQLNSLLDHPEIIRQKGSEGKTWVEKHHDISNVIKEVYKIYQREGWISSLPWDE